MVVYRLVGRDVRAAGGVSIDTVQPVGGVTLRLRLKIYIVPMVRGLAPLSSSPATDEMIQLPDVLTRAADGTRHIIRPII